MKRGCLTGLLVVFGLLFFLVSSLFCRQPEVFNTPARARGDIYDFEGRLLATSRPQRGLFVDPRSFVATTENIKLLAQIAGLKPEALRVLLVQKAGPFLLKENISATEGQKLAGLSGVFSLTYFKRIYPFIESTGSLIGKVSSLGRGVVGLEAAYDSFLSRPRSSLRTAIDLDLQQDLQKELNKALKVFHAREGGAAMLDVASGRLLALVSTSSLNPLLTDTVSLQALSKTLDKAFGQSSYEDRAAFLRSLGFGSSTHIDLGGEKTGLLPLQIVRYTEVQATPLQILRGLSTLASGQRRPLRVAFEVHVQKKAYLIPPKGQKVSGLKPLRYGGLWWSGGNRRRGYFFLAGLWPRKHPRVAYVMYVKGVKVWGLPVYPSRLCPQKALEAYVKTFGRSSTSKAMAKNVMPDVTGLTLRAALERLAPLAIKVRYRGFGVIVKQWPQPGTPLKNVRECKLVLHEDV